MKTGRLLKFRGDESEVQAYLYREAGRYHAAIYVSAQGGTADPALTLSGNSEEDVEAAVRSWVSQHASGTR